MNVHCTNDDRALDVRPQGRRRSMATLLTVLLASVAVVLPVSMAAAQESDTPPRAAAATAGAAWLESQLATIPVSIGGSPSWGATLDAALALVATGSGAERVDAVWSAVEADLDAVVTQGSTDSPGALAKVIMLAVAVGEDPTSVGPAPDEDLITRLLATQQGSGLFGAGSPTYDGAYRQGLAIVALHVAGRTVPAAAVTWLESQQCVGEYAGAWMPYRADTAVPCAPDPAAFVGPDTNSTAFAVAALALVDADAAVAAGLDWLASARLPGGGWEGGEGWGMDPNSTAAVMQALVTSGAADDERFVSGTTPIDALLSFFLGCAAPEADRGAFTYPGSDDAPNLMATAQAVPAAAGAGIDLRRPETFSAQPLDCDPSTTTTTTTTTTPGPGPTAGPGTVPGYAGATSPDGESRPIAFVG